MKRLFTTLSLFATIAIGACAVDFADAVVIDKQPEGELLDMYRTASAWTNYYGIYTYNDYDALIGRVVVADDAVYLYNPCSMYDTRTWIKGDLAADGKVTFNFPQCVVKRDDTSDPLAWQLFFAYKMHQGVDEDGFDVCIAEDEGSIEFLWKDGKLTQTSDGFIGICRDGGEWLGYADNNIEYVPMTDMAEVPADFSAIESKDFTLKYLNYWDDEVTRMVTGGFLGDELWLQGVCSLDPSWWIKGKCDGDKVRIYPQYLGADFTGTGFYIYCLPCEWDYYYDEEMEYLDYEYTPVDYVEFTYDKAAGTLVSDGVLIINGGKNSIYNFDEIMEPELQVFDTKPATPADPIFKNYIAFMPLFGDGFVSWYIPCKDTEGKYLNPMYLYWRIYVDNDTEPYTLLAEDYPLLEEDMVDIPWLASYDYGPVYANDEVHEFMFLFEGARGIGCQSVYKACGEEHCSNIIYWGKAPINAVEAVDVESEAVQSEYFDLQGRRVDAAKRVPGIYIKVNRYDDGHVAAEKYIVK